MKVSMATQVTNTLVGWKVAESILHLSQVLWQHANKQFALNILWQYTNKILQCQ